MSQSTPTIRRARLAASESPNATDDQFIIRGGSEEPLRHLPAAANALREALYTGNRQPSDAEKEQVYHQIVAMVGSRYNYTRKAHSNFCTKKQRKRTMGPRHIIAAKMDTNPNPTYLDILVWAKATGISSWEVFRIVEAEVPEAVKQLAEGERLLDSFTF